MKQQAPKHENKHKNTTPKTKPIMNMIIITGNGSFQSIQILNFALSTNGFMINNK